MKKLLPLFFCLMLFSLAGCSKINSHNNYDWLPQAQNKDEILLYDKFDLKIIAYNKKNHMVTKKNETPNYMQFEFNDLSSNIYTTGHSIENHYKIIEKDEDTTRTLYEMGENDAIFPLAYLNKNEMYFLKTSYDLDGGEIYEKRIICQFNVKKRILKEIKVTQGLRTSSGVMVDDLLYFTVYDEVNNSYDLYSLNINNLDKIELIEKGLKGGGVYNNRGLWVSDGNMIYNFKDKSMQFPEKSLNYFYHDKLFQIGINRSADLQLTITDTMTGNREATFDRLVDVRIQNDEIDVYTLDKIEKLKQE